MSGREVAEAAREQTGRGLLVLGARNLGGAIADHFAAGGWKCAAVARSEDTLARVRERGHHAIAADASDLEALDGACAEAREALGSLDAIVNAVSVGGRPGGVFGGGPLAQASPEDFEHYCLAVARQAFAFLSVGSRALGEGGTLVQITGGSSRRAIPGRGPWAAGAFASRALTQSAALELREQGIHATLLIVDATISSPKTRAPADDTTTSMEDVARAVEYLVSQEPRAWTHELQITPRADRWVP